MTLVKKSARPGTRVYEYEDEQGNVYYSFTRSVGRITPPTRLFLRSRIGTGLINFLVEMRRRGVEFALGPPEEGDEG